MAVKTYNLATQGELKLSEHFKVKEFRSYSSTYNKLYTNTVLIDDNLIELLEKAYSYMDAGKAIINTGYRCPAHNRAIGGASASKHLQGIAADVVYYDRAGKLIDPIYVCCVFEILGAKGIGRMRTATHVDTRPASQKWFGDETVREGGTYKNIGRSFFAYFGFSREAIERKFRKGVIELTEERVREIIREELVGAKTSVPDWAEKDWKTAKALEITDGTRPEGYAKRDEVAAMIVRAIQLEE